MIPFQVENYFPYLDPHHLSTAVEPENAKTEKPSTTFRLKPYLARVSVPDQFILCFRLELLADLLNEDVVHSPVQVPGDQEDQEPVSDVCLLDQMPGLFPVALRGLLDDEIPPEAGHADESHHINGVKGRDEGEDDEPEPDSDVDLLVDDVETEHTQGVHLLDGS